MDINSFNNDQHLTQEELAEYNQGTLSNKEMHRLELHLIDCDLCNDALEGILLVDSPAFSGSLDNIKSRTNIEEKFELNQKHWMAIAASVVLIAVVSIVFYLIPKDSSQMLAEETVVEDKALKEQPSLSPSEPPRGEVEELDTVSTEVTQQENLLATSTDQPVVVEAEARATVAQPSFSEPSPTTLAENNQTDEDTIGQNSIATLSSTQEELDVASGARSKKAATEPEAQSLEDAAAANLSNSANDNYSPALPEKGQRSYDRYLKRKLEYPANAKDNNIEGNVVLQLTIDPSGNITDVIITESLGYGCDEEAIRLVNQGPKWDSGERNGSTITDTVLVTIPFKL